MKYMLLAIASLVTLTFACDELPVPTTCEELAPEIVDSSKQNRYSTILSVYNIKSVTPTESTNTLDCTADVEWSNPDLVHSFFLGDSIKYFMRAEDNGEYRIYYEPLPSEEVPTIEETLKQIEEEMEAAMDAEMKRILQRAQSNTTAKSSSTPIPTTLREIMSDYRENEARADIKYEEPFTLTANVTQIESDGLMLGAGSIFNHVKAHVSDKNSLAIIDSGDEVNLTCRGASGSSDNIGVIINLKQCSLVR